MEGIRGHSKTCIVVDLITILQINLWLLAPAGDIKNTHQCYFNGEKITFNARKYNFSSLFQTIPLVSPAGAMKGNL